MKEESRGVRERLRREGYLEGVPAHVAAPIVHGDIRLYSRQPCPECGFPRLNVRAMQKEASYRLVCICSLCGAELEA